MARIKTVMILAASRYYLRSIEATRRAGYRVVAVDRNPAAAGLASADHGEVCDIVDREGVLRLARTHRIDGIVPVNDYGVPTAAFVAAAMGLPGISPAAAHLATDKEAMRRCWRAAGVPGPEFAVAADAAAAREAIRRIGLPCILKPAHGIGGASRGVIVVRAHAEIDAALTFTHRFYEDKTTLVEQFVEAEVEHSAEVLIWRGTPYVIAIADKIKSPLPYRVDRNVLYPTRIQGERLTALHEVIAQAVEALDIGSGAAHVELATVDAGFMLFELGARCGGGGTPAPIVPYVTGIEEFVETVRILCGDAPQALEPSRCRGCNYHFLSFPPGRVAAIRGFEAVRDHPQVLDAELLIKEGETVPPLTFGGERSGFIIVGAATAVAALELGRRLERGITVEYAADAQAGTYVTGEA
jgi:biotin carboxylase